MVRLPSYVCTLLGEFSLCYASLMHCDPFDFHILRIIVCGTLPCAFNAFLFGVWFQRGRNCGPKQVRSWTWTGKERSKRTKRGLPYDQEQWGRNEDQDQGNGPTIRGKWHWRRGSLISIDHKRGQDHGKGKTWANSSNLWWNKISIGIIVYFN